MGNNSVFLNQNGCEINRTKLEYHKDYLQNDKDIDDLMYYGLGGYMDGWKIYDYWFPEFIEFLEMVSKTLNLTEYKTDNYVKMRDEEFNEYYIYFYKINNEIKIEYSYIKTEEYYEELSTIKT